MAIDVGAAATDRGSGAGQAFTPIVGQENPANATGTIDTVEMWFLVTGENVEVASFYVVSGDNLSTRDFEALGTVVSGSKQTFSGLDMDIETGDYLGTYFTHVNATLERDNSGTGYWYNDGTDYIPCTNQAFTNLGSRTISLYGTGTEAGGTDHVKNLSDSLSLSDSPLKVFDKNIAEGAMSLADSISKEPGKILSEAAMGISDTIVKDPGKILADSVAIADAQVKVFEKQPSDTIDIADSFDRTADFIRPLSDTHNIADTIAKTFTKALSDTFNIADTFAQTGCCDGHGAVGGTIIEVELVGLFANRSTTWKYDITDIAYPLVICAWA